MQEQLDIAYVVEHPHTEQVECDLVYPEGYCRAFISCLGKLAPDHLIAFEVEQGKRTLAQADLPAR
jgi:hypothetical protein